MNEVVSLALVTLSICGVGSLFILLPFVAIMTSLAFFVGWIWMLLDVIQRDETTFKSKDEKLLWVLIVVLGNWMGVFLYYILEYRRYRELDCKKK